MPTVTDGNGKTIINIFFPKKKLEEMLNRLGFEPEISDDFKKMSVQQAKILLAVTLREFFKGNLFLEEMTEIVHSLGLFFIDHKSEDRVDGNTLDQITFDASDMVIGARANANSHERETFNWYLVHLKEYLKKYGSVFDSVTDEEYRLPSHFEEESIKDQS